MVQNVSKPTYFGSDHVLNSKLVSEPCKHFWVFCKIDPKHDQNFIEHILRLFENSTSGFIYTDCTYRSALVNRRSILVSVHTTFLINKHRKIPIIHTISVPDIQRHKGLAHS